MVSEYEQQLRQVCRWNQDLARKNALLHIELRSKDQECQELSTANANLRVERDSIDATLGAAMDEALKARRR